MGAVLRLAFIANIAYTHRLVLSRDKMSKDVSRGGAMIPNVWACFSDHLCR